MTTAPNNSDDLGEYKLPEEDTEASYTLKEPAPEKLSQKKQLFPNLSPRNKKIAIVVAIVVVLFILYQLFTPSSKPQKLQQPTVTTTSTPPDTTQQLIASAQVTSLQQEVNANKTNVTQLQASVMQMQATITELKNVIYTLNAATQKLSQNVLQLAAKQEPKVPTKMPKVFYHIRAIVSGRAWLESSQGKVVTVSPGTELLGYGTVKAIDPTQGTVTTDKGFVIHYGSNDT